MYCFCPVLGVVLVLVVFRPFCQSCLIYSIPYWMHCSFLWDISCSCSCFVWEHALADTLFVNSISATIYNCFCSCSDCGKFALKSCNVTAEDTVIPWLGVSILSLVTSDSLPCICSGKRCMAVRCSWLIWLRAISCLCDRQLFVSVCVSIHGMYYRPQFLLLLHRFKIWYTYVPRSMGMGVIHIVKIMIIPCLIAIFVIYYIYSHKFWNISVLNLNSTHIMSV